MNEKIKELAKQATNQYSPTYYTPEWIQSFATLIVRECIRKYQELDDAVAVYSLGEGKEVTKEQLILRHFGIK